ncbi:MAG TPA: TrmH family RNA methyltransferase [Vicinamibacteria bacterium]|nr:TrmH family RNA methyltransferase [Vicinamibacteria bacterium]
MDLSRVEVVLVRPARAANVAAACRAMKNMGLRRLWLVGAEALRLDADVRGFAYGAWEVLDQARRAESLAEAVAASTLVVATTGRPLAGAWSPRRLAAGVAARAGGGVCSLVFGPEATGLTGAELDACHLLVHVPTDPAQPSLNLAQAVLLVAYELRLATRSDADATLPPAPDVAEAPAPAGALEEAVQELRQALLEIGYLDPANPERILTELRRLLARMAPTRRELVLLRGLARQASWAGRVARGREGKG